MSRFHEVDLLTGVLRAPSWRLMEESLRPLKEPAQCLSEWMNLWYGRFGTSHMVELFILLGFTSLCVNGGKAPPTLLLAGPPDIGKTELMGFVSLMLGFSGSKLYLAGKVTKFALEDHLHYLSGFPTFCNDPDSKKQLDAIRGGNSIAATKDRTRNGNGSMCLAVNEEPLRNILDAPEEIYGRCVVVPVSPVQQRRDSLVEELCNTDASSLPSSVGVIQALVPRPPQPRVEREPKRHKRILGAKPLERAVKGQRLQKNITSLYKATLRVIQLVDDDWRYDIEMSINAFFEGPMIGSVKEHQLPPEDPTKTFLRRVRRAFFQKDNQLKPEFKLKDSKGNSLIEKHGKNTYFVAFSKMVNFLKLSKSEADIRKGLQKRGLYQKHRKSDVRGAILKIGPKK